MGTTPFISKLDSANPAYACIIIACVLEKIFVQIPGYSTQLLNNLCSDYVSMCVYHVSIYHKHLWRMAQPNSMQCLNRVTCGRIWKQLLTLYHIRPALFTMNK